MNINLANQYTCKLAVLLIVLLGGVLACAGHMPPRPSDEILDLFLHYRQRLQTAVHDNRWADVEQELLAWTAVQPPIALEGDLYAELLIAAPPDKTNRGWQTLATIFLQRFPNHPEAWAGMVVEASAKLAQGDIVATAELWQRMNRAPSAARQQFARRIAEVLWQTGQTEASLEWALRSAPKGQQAAYWSLLFERAWQCCQAPLFAGTVIGDLLKLKAAVASGNSLLARQLALQLRKFLQENDPNSLWYALAEYLSEGHAALENNSKKTLGLIAPLNGPQQSIGRSALAVAIACLDMGAMMTIGDSKGRAGPALAALEELPTRQLLGPFRTNELVAASLPLFSYGWRAVTPNPLAPAELPVSSAIWFSAISPEDQASAMARLALSRGWRAVAILAPANRYGERFAAAIWPEVTGRGGWLTGLEFYEPSAPDFGKTIKALVGLDRYSPEELVALKEKNEQPKAILDFDVLLVVGAAADIAKMPAQLAYNDIVRQRVLGDGGWNSPRVAELGREYLHGALFIWPAPTTSSELTQAALPDCLTTVSAQPNPYEYSIFDAQRFLLSDLSLDDSGVSEFEGATGRVQVAADHQFRRYYGVYQWRRGKVVVWNGEDPLEMYRSEAPPPAKVRDLGPEHKAKE